MPTGTEGDPHHCYLHGGQPVRIERLQKIGLRFIHKPFSPEMIRDTLKDVLGSEVFHERSH